MRAKQRRKSGGVAWSRVFYFSCGLLAISVSLVWAKPLPKYTINLTPSLPRGLYAYRDGAPDVGDFVVFEGALVRWAFPSPSHFRSRLLKKIAAKNEEGECFLVGDHPKSFDSHSFGSLPASHLKKVVPLWLWDEQAPGKAAR